MASYYLYVAPSPTTPAEAAAIVGQREGSFLCSRSYVPFPPGFDTLVLVKRQSPLLDFLGWPNMEYAWPPGGGPKPK